MTENATRQISDRLKRIQDRIQTACARSGRDPGGVRLVAVSKTMSVETVRAGIEAGLTVFGENYIQEAQRKIREVNRQVSWHFIGHLQSNKARHAAGLFDLIHSVDSLKLARELNKRASVLDRRLPILIQVNLAGEETKAGTDREAVKELTDQINELSHLDLRGLMTMPPYFDQPDKARPFFAALRKLRDDIGAPLKELSMGMTGDFEAAIEEGATIIRVGTALFGPRV